MDAEDILRTRKHLAKLRDELRKRGVMSNHEVRRCAGSRGMGRVNELQKLGLPITIRKLDKSTWEVRWNAPPLARDAGTRVNQKPLPMLPF